MPGRTHTNHRFGFNGKENDKDAGAYDFGARLYNSKLGRWWSVDAMAGKYPQLSPYNFTGNNPVLFVDYDGNDFGLRIDHTNKTVTVVMDINVVDKTTYKQALKAAHLWNGHTTKLENGYTVNFEICVEPNTDEEPTDLTARTFVKFANDNMFQKTDDYRPTHNISNYYLGVWQTTLRSKLKDKVLEYGGEGEVGGNTFRGLYIQMYTLYIFQNDVMTKDSPFITGNKTKLVGHEFGHLMGLEDFFAKGVNKYFSIIGIMKYNGMDVKDLHDEDVINVIKYASDALKRQNRRGLIEKEKGNPYDGPQVTKLQETGDGDFSTWKFEEYDNKK